MRSITVTCPAEIARQNHQRKNRKTWRSSKWRAAKAEFLKKNPICAFCGKPAQTPHHIDMSVYGTPAYEDLTGCIPLCHRCHSQHHDGKVLCKICKDHYHAPEFDCCIHCADPEDIEYGKFRKESLKRRKRKQPIHHPCLHREKYQACQNGGTCNYSWKRARECGGFMARAEAPA